jgi:hypothetical protein
LKQPHGQGEASWKLGAASLLGLLGVLAWLLQLGEVLSFRTGFLCNLTILTLIAFCLSKGRSFGRSMVENRAQAALLLLVVVAAILTRTVGLDRFPPADGQLWEETQTGKVAYDTLRFGSLDPYFPLTNLIGEIGFRLLDVSMTALRLPFVALGIASVPLFFLAARFFLRTFAAALVATALFATSAYLSSASRVALETMAPIFTVSLALAITFRACVHRSTSAFAFAGIANGVLMLEYFSYKLLPPLLGLCLLGYLLQEEGTPFCNRPGGRYRMSRLLELRSGLFVFAFFGLAVAVPLVLFDPVNPLGFFLEGFYRQQVGIEQVSVGFSIAEKLRLTAARVVDSTGFVFLRGRQSDIVASSRGVVDVPTGLLGLAALFYCAARAWRCPGKLFLVGSTVLLVVLSGALVGNPARYRLTPLVPIYFLTLATALDDLMGWFLARQRRLVALAVLTGGLCLLNLRSLAVDVLDHPSTQAELYDLPLLLVTEIKQLQTAHPRARIYLVSNFDYLAGVSDYEFLYDPGGVEVVTSPSRLRGKSGYVLAHDVHVAGVVDLAETSECRSWRTKIRRNLIVRCRLN